MDYHDIFCILNTDMELQCSMLYMFSHNANFNKEKIHIPPQTTSQLSMSPELPNNSNVPQGQQRDKKDHNFFLIRQKYSFKLKKKKNQKPKYVKKKKGGVDWPPSKLKTAWGGRATPGFFFFFFFLNCFFFLFSFFFFLFSFFNLFNF
jgi:hypothetical protein